MEVSGATSATFTPPAWDTSGNKKYGNVQVRISAAGYESKTWTKVIYAAPEWVNFYGVWKMEGSKNGNWKPTGASTVTDETMVIKYEVFAQSGTTPRSFVRDTYTSPY
jgi:hypothetical protein